MPEHDLESIAFPTLDEAQIATLSRCSSATGSVSVRTAGSSGRSSFSLSALTRASSPLPTAQPAASATFSATVSAGMEEKCW